MDSSLRRSTGIVMLLTATLLAGCEWLGIEQASVVAARREAAARAIGAGCRHAGRAIEDCYALNQRVDKGAILAGWREMNDYMRENKVEEVLPAAAGATAPEEKIAAAKGKGEPAGGRMQAR